MRLVIDLIGAQSRNSRNRGIGRYTTSLAKAMIKLVGSHEVHVSVSDAFPDTIEPIFSEFRTLLPRENLTCWNSITSSAYVDTANEWRARSSEIVREAWLASLKPDLLHVGSFFEGFWDDATVSIGKFVPSNTTGITLYDLIPYIHREMYLSNKRYETWYDYKINELSKAGVLLAISESSRREAIDLLGIRDEQVVTISTAAEPIFRPTSLTEMQTSELKNRYGLRRPFLMYTGGIDHRKNIDGLITAFSQLPESVRQQHQLAIVCSARDEDVALLKHHAKKQGLRSDDLVMTGYVPEADLVALYNNCKAFCFPSIHEGFGLPALEAMQCGAPTIGSNLSSIPEVIGLKDALFDPRNSDDFTGKLNHVLTDAGFRKTLSEHGLSQSSKFSWDASAKRAWAGFEALYSAQQEARRSSVAVSAMKRPRLAYISPLPPERSGIADYSVELLPALGEFYDIDVVVNQDSVDDVWVNKNCQVRSIEWFKENAWQYDRILYHFGNSVFHRHMFELARLFPGVVVLHDFYLSGIIAHMTIHDHLTGFWERALYDSHGYPAVVDRYNTANSASIVYRYPANMPAIRDALGVIVHSQHSKDLAAKFYGNNFAQDWGMVPHLRQLPTRPDKSEIRKELGYHEDDFIVCSFGAMGQLKLNHRLISAWLNSELSQNKNSYLIFVGTEPEGEYAIQLKKLTSGHGSTSQIKITGFAPPDSYRKYLAIADIAVQLRSLSRGETSGTSIDCMANELVAVVNAHGAMAELPVNCVTMIDDEFSDADLTSALESLYNDPVLRQGIGAAGRSYVENTLSPKAIAKSYSEQIERFYMESPNAYTNYAIEKLGGLDIPRDDTSNGLFEIADAVAGNSKVAISHKRLFVDISELIQIDNRTGIQRVVRSILKELFDSPPNGYRIEPVYSIKNRNGYYFARRFTMKFWGHPTNVLEDRKIDFRSGDIFLGLDLHHQSPAEQADYIAKMRRFGVFVAFVVYDLLPIRLPEAFPEVGFSLHSNWLKSVSRSADGLVCISNAVADEVREWLQENTGDGENRPAVESFHLGADIANSKPSQGVPSSAREVVAMLKERPTFLTVGTIEPRKSYSQILSAFEGLWASGVDANLVIIGKQGWMVERLIDAINGHQELNRRLFWLQNISDEYLEIIYASSDCLIAASQGEGFGLPLIEASAHNLPVIARDIPVFREVAGESAHYFSGLESKDLSGAIEEWLILKEGNTMPRLDGMKRLTWKESCQELLSRIFDLASKSNLARGVVDNQ
ncbi:glycosyltransferase [Rhizobium sp. RCC_161_2]|uniref:glycosyltransferase n=1 Tax=Rhizobium sp. RCC_161_2 TaxID=3239219 RepID=UPI00352513A0